jgi:predicted SnoaL-like aldol condensation-catalyzing enzyme
MYMVSKYSFIFRATVLNKIVFTFFLFVNTNVIAQKNVVYNEDSIFKQNSITAEGYYSGAVPYYTAFFKNKIPAQIKIVKKITDCIAIITLQDKNEFDTIAENAIINAANGLWKFSPQLQSKFKNGNIPRQFIVTGLQIDSLLYVLQHRRDDVFITAVNKPSQSVIIKCKPAYLINNLLPLKEIIFADNYVDPETETAVIGYKRNFHGLNVLDYTIPGANGKNIVVGIKEQRMDAADLDLYKRVVASSIAAAAVENHATVIATLIGGAGNSFYDGRGIANTCNFFSSSFFNLFADDAAVLNQQKVTVQNHSYGTVVQQFYGAEAVSYDIHAWQNKNFVHVFSSGNRGQFFATEGKYANITNFANLTGNFKMAKNIITVGAIDNEGNVAAASSAGPLYDGRLAPQLTALGPNGTSDAAAIVSGTVAVMQQVYADSNNQILPAAALVKAILFNTADDIYTPGIDYKTGYGVLNSYEAVKAIQQKKYESGTVAQGQVWAKNILVPGGLANFKITLSFTDSAAGINNNKALVNDLDLTVEEISSGIIYKPWVLGNEANADSLQKLPVRKRDSLNTAEQVSIALPNAGNYRVRVTGTNVVLPLLAFCMAFNADTLNTFSFTNPQHASDVNRDEDEKLVIKWKAAVADTNQTGNLFITYNNGVSWQLIKQAVKINARQYSWPIKDTASAAALKMETTFGTFQSKNFIISKVNRLAVDFICSDSFQLSWNKHIYASGYKIYALTDSAFLKPLLVVTDTFSILKKANYPYLVYAVEPVLNNGLPAARSIALNIEVQGVNCFYKTFNVAFLDSNNINLTLELSITKYVDSITFERVTIQGQFIESYGRQKITGNGLIYDQFITNLPPGVTYFRGKIILKNGSVIYTDLISVLTTGDKNIIVYPNPVKSGGLLNYLLKSQTQTYHLQLLDISGRFIRDWEIKYSGAVKLPVVPAGIYVYRLTDEAGAKKSSGKIIIN